MLKDTEILVDDLLHVIKFIIIPSSLVSVGGSWQLSAGEHICEHARLSQPVSKPACGSIRAAYREKRVQWWRRGEPAKVADWFNLEVQWAWVTQEMRGWVTC